MKPAALFAIPLTLLLVTAIRAQQKPAASTASSQTASGPPSATAPMTPLQIAVMRGDILMARKEFREAIRAYEQILSEHPKNAEVLNKMGIAFQQLDYLKTAGHCYKKSMKADKKYASAVNNLGTVEYEEHHYGKAIKLYSRAVPLGQDLSIVYSNLGYAYFADKKYPRAMSSFEQALALDPDVFTRKSENGTIIQQRTATDPGLFYYFVAKTYALSGDAEHAAHYLKLARDDGYKEFINAKTDPAFAKVIADPRVKDVLVVPASYASGRKQPRSI
ncbi:MAG: tetratricopeptide repeat protein [Candidatus Acidiferrales bacterium]